MIKTQPRTRFELYKAFNSGLGDGREIAACNIGDNQVKNNSNKYNDGSDCTQAVNVFPSIQFFWLYGFYHSLFLLFVIRVCKYMPKPSITVPNSPKAATALDDHRPNPTEFEQSKKIGTAKSFG